MYHALFNNSRQCSSVLIWQTLPRLPSLEQHSEVPFLSLIPKSPFQTQGKSPTAYMDQRQQQNVDSLVHFSCTFNFKAILFSLCVLLWNNLKTYSFALSFPGSALSQHLWRTFILRRKGMCPFPLLSFYFFLFRPQRHCRRAELFFYFFHFIHWIFIRWWILPQ